MNPLRFYIPATLFITLGFVQASESVRPNIIIVLADDLGWSELGCYGNRFNETPHLDRLAAQGLRFSQAYAAAPVCSPYRAALLTGQAPARIGIVDYLRPNSANALSVEQVTLPEILRRNGYRTGMIGKWHLTGYQHHGAEHEVKPRQHGFDWDFAREVKGVGNGANFWPYVFRDQAIRWLDIPDNRLGENEYLTDRMNQEAVDFIERNASRPFFLYLSHYAPHSILHGKPELVEKYRKKHPPGKSTREKCYLCEDLGYSGDELNHWAGDHNPHLAAMLESIDNGIGMIRSKLQTLGIANNTILLFTSDNGGETNVTSNEPLRGGKSELYEGGIRVPLILQWSDEVPAGAVCDQPTSNVDLYPTLLDAVGVQADKTQTLDGVSTLATWKSPEKSLNRPFLCWHYPLDQPHFLGGRSAGAIRQGDWKLIEFFDSEKVELYSLSNDPSEREDIAEQHPETVAKLKKNLEDWREKIGARTPSPPLVATPRQLMFADHFSSGQVSSRWFFNGNWEAIEGRLQRVEAAPETTRIFAKDLQYANTIVRFDFQLQNSRDVRFITGSHGSYNTIIHILPDHFKIETGMDKSGPYYQHWHGECAFDFAFDRWYTMTIEFLDDHAVAHIDDDHVAYAKHPTIAKTRDYFAFQVDRFPAAFDNVQVFTAYRHSNSEENLRQIKLIANKYPVQRSLAESLRIAKTNAHDRLYQEDEGYRVLVERLIAIDQENKAKFPNAFLSHKETREGIAEARRKLLKEDPRFKEKLFATYRANREIDRFLIEQEPHVEQLPESRRKRELESLRRRYQDDSRFVNLIQQRTALQDELEQAYPQLFVTDQEIRDNRRRRRNDLQKVPEFRDALKERSDAWNEQQDYLLSHDEVLSKLHKQMKQLKATTSESP